MITCAALLTMTGCEQTTKDVSKTETMHKDQDGKTVKTETTVEKKTSVDK